MVMFFIYMNSGLYRLPLYAVLYCRRKKTENSSILIRKMNILSMKTEYPCFIN